MDKDTLLALIEGKEPNDIHNDDAYRVQLWNFDTFIIEVRTSKITGEVSSPVIRPKPKKIYKPKKVPTNGFIKLYHEELDKANDILSFEEMAILNAAIRLVGWKDNQVYNKKGQLMSIAEFAEYVKKGQHFVGKILKLLDTKGLIKLEDNGNGKSKIIRVMPRLAWRGDITEDDITKSEASSQRSEIKEDIDTKTKIEDVIAKPQNAPNHVVGIHGQCIEDTWSEGEDADSVTEDTLQEPCREDTWSTEDSAVESQETEVEIDETVNDEEDSAAITPDPYAAVYERRNAYAIAKAMIEEGKREEAKELLLKYDMTLAITALRL